MLAPKWLQCVTSKRLLNRMPREDIMPPLSSSSTPPPSPTTDGTLNAWCRHARHDSTIADGA
eukprot:3745795-Pyramimonas_sp.AAC.1